MDLQRVCSQPKTEMGFRVLWLSEIKTAAEISRLTQKREKKTILKVST